MDFRWRMHTFFVFSMAQARKSRHLIVSSLQVKRSSALNGIPQEDVGGWSEWALRTFYFIPPPTADTLDAAWKAPGSWHSRSVPDRGRSEQQQIKLYRRKPEIALVLRPRGPRRKETRYCSSQQQQSRTLDLLWLEIRLWVVSHLQYSQSSL